MYIILGILASIVILSLVIMVVEIKNAPTIDEKEPFVWEER